LIALVHLSERWIADVGFGGRSIEPLHLEVREPQVYERRSYVVANDAEHYFITVQDPWVAPHAPKTYVFTLARTLGVSSTSTRASRLTMGR